MGNKYGVTRIVPQVLCKIISSEAKIVIYKKLNGKCRMRVLISILLLICFVSLCGCGPVTPVSREGDNRSTVSSDFGSPEIIIKSDEICYFDIVGKNCVYSYPDETVCVLDTNTGKIKSSFIVGRFRYEEDSNTVDRLQYYDEHSQFFQVSNASMPVLAVNGGELDKGGDDYGLIDIYDLYLGKKLKTVRTKNDLGLTGLGFSGDGKYFYFGALDYCSFYCVDVKSGDIIWRSHLSDLIPLDRAYIRIDGISYVICNRDYEPLDNIIAFNKEGVKLWRSNKIDWMMPTPQPVGPSDVLFVLINEEDKKHEIGEISLQNVRIS